MNQFVGYFDDSGRLDGAFPVSVVGGFVASPSEWLGFNHRWKNILGKYGVDVHRQSKWSNRAAPFDDPHEWPKDRLEGYLSELLDLITSLDAVTVGAAVPHERFSDNFPGGRDVTSPFGYAAQCVFGAAADLLKERVPEARIAYVFESGTLGFGEVKRTFDECLGTPEVKERFGLVSLTTADKRDDMRLQAADLMAYEVYKLYKEGDESDSWNPRYPLRYIRRPDAGSVDDPKPRYGEEVCEIGAHVAVVARTSSIAGQDPLASWSHRALSLPPRQAEA